MKIKKTNNTGDFLCRGYRLGYNSEANPFIFFRCCRLWSSTANLSLNATGLNIPISPLRYSWSRKAGAKRNPPICPARFY